MTLLAGGLYTSPQFCPEGVRALRVVMRENLRQCDLVGKDAPLRSCSTTRLRQTLDESFRTLVRWVCALVVTFGCGWVTGAAATEITFPTPAVHETITVRADAASGWTQGLYQVRHLQGGVAIEQGATVVRGDNAVVWVQQPGSESEQTKVIVYVEGSAGRAVTRELRSRTDAKPTATQTSPDWLGRFYSAAPIRWQTPAPMPPPQTMPSIYHRGWAQIKLKPEPTGQTTEQPRALPKVDPAVQPAQFEQAAFQPPFAAPALVAPPGAVVPNAGGIRRVQIFPRSAIGPSAEFLPLETGERAAVISGGVNVIVEGVPGTAVPGFLGAVDKIDLETDRAVVWTSGDGPTGMQFDQSNDAPLEIYMEGNIVFRQGDRTIYAERMYYDVRRRTGVILDAELLTPLPEIRGRQYPGLVRLKAGVVRQLDDARFVANQALFTTSRLEAPSYDLSSDTIFFEDIRTPIVDPATGITTYEHERLAKSQGNRVNVAGVPIFYWPTFATDLEEPTFYVSDIRVGNDSIFGFRTLIDFDVYQVFGIDRIDGTKWDLSLDYLSDRGFGVGTEFQYQRDQFFGLNGPAAGRFDFWAIKDGGLDNLGFGRRDLVPEEDYRGRAFWNHRQKIAGGVLDGWTAQAELGWISDRTFLEQYYEPEWDENKSQDTGVRLKRLFGNQSFSIEANGRLNHFFTQTQWLPRLDHYILGQEILGDTATWFAHSSAAYANLKVASTPTNPVLAGDFALFPWEVDGDGERLITRQEIDFPIDLDPVKIVPYALGELAQWGSDIDGNSLQRSYVHTGVRASIPFWAVNPAVQDPLFNLNGLAHKVVFDAEVSFTDANRNLNDVPLYDELDDDSIEEIRRRLAGPFFDPRFYAVRTGMQGWVTAPSMEVVEDQTAVRFGMRHRLQTKRGGPGRVHTVDWMTFDSNLSLFPNADRDNFGEELGLADYDFRWHVGDRVSIVSDGFADVFADGLKTISAGMRFNRPARGNLYLGYRTIRGPFSADLITATINYRLGPKWVTSASTVFDFSEAGNIGQSFAITRVGESLNTTIGVNVDESKDNVGFNFLIEPRFLSNIGLTRRTGINLPPAGVEYLE